MPANMETNIKKYLIAGVCFVGMFIGLLLSFSYYQHQQITYPKNLPWLPSNVLGQITKEASPSTPTKLGIVYGFLPYWNLSNYTINSSVSHLVYFRLAVNGKGEIVKESSDGGYKALQSERMHAIHQQIKNAHLKYEITFFTSISSDIDELIECQSCQDTFIQNLADTISEHNLDGINIDFEYSGYVSSQKRQKFTNLMYRISNLLETRFPRTKLSVDVYGGAAEMNNLWDFPLLAKIVDRVIVMGYDYKTRKSLLPGPSAPLLGKDTFGGDIWEDVRTLMKYVPNQKIVLAIPFYGYAWETTSDDLKTAQTYPDSGQTLTYKGARKLLADKELKVQERWDEHSLTPYLVWQTSEEIAGQEELEQRWHIGFFENPRSLNYKIDMVSALNLGGIAIWALGYEGQYDELWQTITQRF